MYEEALRYYEMNLTTAKQIGDKSGEGRAYGNLGNCYTSLRKYDKAIQYHETRLDIAKQIGDKSGEDVRMAILATVIFLSESTTRPYSIMRCT